MVVTFLMHCDMVTDITWWDRASVCQLRSLPFSIVLLMPFWGADPNDLSEILPPHTIWEYAGAIAGLMGMWASPGVCVPHQQLVI